MKSLPEITGQLRYYQHNISVAKNSALYTRSGVTGKYLEKLERKQKKLFELEKQLTEDYSEFYQEKKHTHDNLVQLLKKATGETDPFLKKKESKRIHSAEANFETISDKKLLKHARKTIELASAQGAYSILSFGKLKTGKIRKKLIKVAEASQGSRLSKEDMVQLDNAAMNFMKAMISVETLEKEKSKLIKQSERLFEKCDHILENKLKKHSVINQQSINEPDIPRNEEEHTNRITKVNVKDILV